VRVRESSRGKGRGARGVCSHHTLRVQHGIRSVQYGVVLAVYWLLAIGWFLIMADALLAARGNESRITPGYCCKWRGKLQPQSPALWSCAEVSKYL
jgi:hypothetical protein